MTEPRPEVVLAMFSLAMRHGCTGAELLAAVNVFRSQALRGRPKSTTYGRLLWGMFALVGVYGRDRFTAAKQILSLVDGPVAQRENQVRALIRRFDEVYEDLPATRDFYARSGPGLRVVEFYDAWMRAGLPWPPDVQSPTDRENELRTLAMASNGVQDAAICKHFVDLDRSIAASTFESGRH
jgi:hypothetical protein